MWCVKFLFECLLNVFCHEGREGKKGFKTRRMTFKYAFLLFAALWVATLADPIMPYPPIVPAPRGYWNGSDTIIVDAAHLKVVTPTSRVPALLQGAFERFKARTFVHEPNANTNNTPTADSIGSLYIQIANDTTPLQLGVEEGYTMDVRAPQVRIISPTLYGAYHALETLSQLIGFNFDTEMYEVHNAPWSVIDTPRFPHRGVLVDTARHYLPLPTLRAVIDSLTYAKMNTLHWHMVDAESFPVDSISYPKLGKLSSFTSRERYTVADVKSIVAYATERGVRVMPEFDVPGHTAAMCKAYPEICPDPFCTSANVNNWALDITKNVTYEVVNGVIRDIASIFGDKMIHLGGDEVAYKCWRDHPYIMKWLEDRNLSVEGGYMYFVKRAQKMVWDVQREVVGWQEIWDHFATDLDKKTIIHQWLRNSTTLPKNVTSHGYRLIWSDSSVWYLDHLATTWQSMYTAEPCTGLTDSECELVLGGEGCQWAETIDTSDILQTIWPRAAAIAERLWSPRTVRDPTQAEDRMIAFRCLLNRRGVAAAPIKNAQARSAPPNPGSCFWQ